MTGRVHFAADAGKAHEVKWFALHHNLAAIKQEKSAAVHAPKSERNQVKPRENLERGLLEASAHLCLNS